MFKVGVYEREITAFLGCSMRGYFNLRLADGVLDKTYAKAVAIEKDGVTTVMIAIDLTNLGDYLPDKIREEVVKLTGLPVQNIMFSATHSHTTGPANPKGEKGADEVLDRFYLDYLVLAVANVAALAVQNMQEAIIKTTTVKVEGISFVRNYVMKDGSYKTNPGRLNPNIDKPFGEPDYDVPVLLFEDKSGNKLGILYSFGCHQDCVDGTKISGDYSSVVAKRMKEKFGLDFVSVYFNGTSGNVNHFNVKTESDAPFHYRYMGNVIADAIIPALDSATLVEGSLAVKTIKKYYEVRVPSVEEMEENAKFIASVEIPKGIKIDASTPGVLYEAVMRESALESALSAKHYVEVIIQVIKIGQVLFFPLFGEVFTQLGKKIKDALPNNVCIFACLSNNRSCYVPPVSCFLPGLYESDIACSRLSGEDNEDIINENINIAKELIKIK